MMTEQTSNETKPQKGTRPALNTELRDYSTFEEEQRAYHAMQAASFKVAEALLLKPAGTVTSAIEGHVYFVAELEAKSELFCSPDFNGSGSDDCNIFMVSQFEGLSADDLKGIEESLADWLKQPRFEATDADTLQQWIDRSYKQKEA